jgi:GNAT superfamily N-acetyltransferase
MPLIKIEPAKHTDFGPIARLWHASWLATGLAVPGDPDASQLRARICSSDSTEWKIYVARSGDELVGFIAFELAKCWVRQLFILPSAQRTGCGTRLLDIAKSAMPTGFWLRTDSENLPARRFYEGRGLRLKSETSHPDTKKLMASYVWP